MERSGGVSALGGGEHASEVQPLPHLPHLGGGVLEQLANLQQRAGLDGRDGPVEVDDLGAPAGRGLDLVPHLQGHVSGHAFPDKLPHALQLHVPLEPIDLRGEAVLGAVGLQDLPRDALGLEGHLPRVGKVSRTVGAPRRLEEPARLGDGLGELLPVGRRLGFAEEPFGPRQLLQGQPLGSISRGGPEVIEKEDGPRRAHQKDDTHDDGPVGDGEPVQKDIARARLPGECHALRPLPARAQTEKRIALLPEGRSSHGANIGRIPPGATSLK